MINVSKNMREYISQGSSGFLPFADITLTNGTVINIDQTCLRQNGYKIIDSVSGSDKLNIGSCNVNKLSLILNNNDDRYSPYDFYGALVRTYLKSPQDDTEIIQKGIFTVADPQYKDNAITLDCFDHMSKFDVDYSGVKTQYPATLQVIVTDICNYCGVSLATPDFPNNNFSVAGRPDDEALTCRQVLSYCAQIACCFGRCNTYGRLELKWFPQEVFDKAENIDGGIFDDHKPYASGDKADGGTFDDYSSGFAADGGTFDDMSEFHHLYALSSFTASTDDVIITGIEVTEEFNETDTDKKETVLSGFTGYVLSISGNKFIQKGRGREVADYLAKMLVGLKFRPMSAQTVGDPTVEAGDLAYITDRKSNSYGCLITNVTFSLGNYMSISCDSETPQRNSAKQYSEMTQAIVEARKSAQRQASSLSSVMAMAFGAFKSEVAQEDGSVIYYMHNKPTLAESLTIWKFASNVFAVSTDGGKTWNAGLDENGNATVNILSAIGINFDWARGGTLTLGGIKNLNGTLVILDENENEIGRWNNGGMYTTGSITSGNVGGAYSVKLYNGNIYVAGSDGKTSGIISYLNDGITIQTYGGSQSASVTMKRDGNMNIWANGEMLLRANSINVGGGVGKTGTAEFSDGSYLKFYNGVMIGGATASGSTF